MESSDPSENQRWPHRELRGFRLRSATRRAQLPWCLRAQQAQQAQQARRHPECGQRLDTSRADSPFCVALIYKLFILNGNNISDRRKIAGVKPARILRVTAVRRNFQLAARELPGESGRTKNLGRMYGGLESRLKENLSCTG